MYPARIVLCFALLGAAAQACAEDTPYRHEYLNGGYFEGAPGAAQASPPDHAAVPSEREATPYHHSYRNGGHFDGEAPAPGGKAPEKPAQTGK
jgi:hypothetical protein